MQNIEKRYKLKIADLEEQLRKASAGS